MKTSRIIVAGVSLMAVSAFAQERQGMHNTFRPFKPGITMDSSTPPPTAITPAQMRSIYGFNLVSNTGTGQTIGIIDWYDDPNIEADLGVFDTQYGVATCTTANGCFKKVYSTGTKPQTNASSAVEISIDVMWAHAIAPGAKIVLVEAPNSSNSALIKAIEVAIQNGARIISMSFGGGEASVDLQIDALWRTFPTVAFVASSGDSGHGVSWPANSPNVIAVGGTTLTHNGGTYTSERAWSDSGGGLSAIESEPSYQTPFQNTGKRGVPDVAYDADPNTGVAIYDSLSYEGIVGWSQWGGTSIGAPQISAMLAIVASERAAASKKALGLPAALYDFVADYHDITTGTNGTCGSLCTAVPGYDFVTGLGTPEANVLIPALVSLP